MSRSNLIFVITLCLAGPLRADTIYQTTAQGREVVVQRDAIVIKDDSSFLIYKHFELKERRVVKVRLNKGSLPYSFEQSSPDARHDIVEIWKKFGLKATVTDLAGKTAVAFDVYLDFYPPGGRGSLLESIPPRTALPVQFDRGGADEIDFADIAKIELSGEKLKITLRKGEVAEGKLLLPTGRPAEVRFMGITDQYDPASDDVFDFALPLAKVKEIKFE